MKSLGAMKPKKKMGRPPFPYSEEMADAICERLADGDSMLHISHEKGMPSYNIVLRWLEKNEGFRLKYARAREAQADRYANETRDIVDAAKTGLDATLARLKFDQRRWHASKLAPKKYGDKLEHTGQPLQGTLVAPVLQLIGHPDASAEFPVAPPLAIADNHRSASTQSGPRVKKVSVPSGD